MKHKTLSGLLAILLLCSAYSGTGVNKTAPDTAVAGLTAVAPMAQQGAVSGFTDVASGAWYEEAANWCREKGILDGDTFSPDMEMTRTTVAEALYRAEGSPEAGSANFPDIPAGSPYANAAAWASSNGVMSGYTNACTLWQTSREIDTAAHGNTMYGSKYSHYK